MIFIYLRIFIRFLCHHREEAQQFVMKFNRDRDGSAREESFLELGRALASFTIGCWWQLARKWKQDQQTLSCSLSPLSVIYTLFCIVCWLAVYIKSFASSSSPWRPRPGGNDPRQLLQFAHVPRRRTKPVKGVGKVIANVLKVFPVCEIIIKLDFAY